MSEVSQRAGKVVVTGVSSFVGMHLASGLRQRGYDVVGTLSRDASGYDGIQGLRIAALLSAGIEISFLDLRDHDRLGEFVDLHKPDVWCQHAGWAVAYGSHDYDLSKGFQINVAPLLPLYDSLSRVNCRGVIVTGSSAEYTDSDLANQESDVCMPSLPYGLAKLAETLRSAQLATQFGLKTRVARIYIPFGPMDAPNKLMSSVVEKLRSGKSIGLSPCTQARDFTHIADIVAGYVCLVDDLDRNVIFDLFNLCRGSATQLRQFLVELAQTMGVSTDLLDFGAQDMRDGEVAFSFGDALKAKKLLGWEAQSLNDSVTRFIQEN